MSPKGNLPAEQDSRILERLTRVGAIAQHVGAIASRDEVQVGEVVVQDRQYQAEVWEELEQRRQEGGDSALLHLATGLGKTTVGVVDSLRFARDFLEENGRLPRILFAVHQTEILDQAAERFHQFAPELPQGMFVGRERSLGNPITFATMQSLNSRLDELDEDEFDYIIYDEAHHAKAETFSRVVEHFKPSFKLALTATPNRMDDENIRDLFGEEVYSKTLAEAMTEGYLADVDYHIVFDDAVKKAMDEGFSIDSLKEIKRLLSNESRNEEIALQIKEQMEKIGLEKAKTIVFCNDIEQADEMAALLGGEPYHSKLSKDQRLDTMNRFRDNGLQIITTRDMFNEGVDVPDARLLVFLRSTASQTIFEQQLGRGLRRTGDKTVVSVLDFVANVERLRHIKELRDKIDQHTQTKSNDRTKSINSRKENGLDIHEPHADFDFDTISVTLLEHLNRLKRPDRNVEKVQTIEEAAILWKKVFDDTRPTTALVDKASAEAKYISGSRIAALGGVRALLKELGMKVIDYKSIDSLEHVADLWNDLHPGQRPTKALIKNASKKGDYVSLNIVNKYGGVVALQEQLGHKVVRKGQITSMDDIASLWQERYPGLTPNKALIVQASRNGDFISEATVVKYGGIDALKSAIGVVEPKAINSMEDVAAIWNESLPNLAPTSDIAVLAYKNAVLPFSTGIIKKYGGIAKLRECLGYTNESIKDSSDHVDSIKEAAELWKKTYPNTEPSKKSILEASKKKSFISYEHVRSIGGLAALKSELGYSPHKTVNWVSQVADLQEAAELWVTNHPGIAPSVESIGKATNNGTYMSLSTLTKQYGSISDLKTQIAQIKNIKAD